jgi:GrpB-like predicted nucleotidyltransferase (UPF0157 family)
MRALPGDDVDIVLIMVDDGSITDEQQRFDLFASKLKTYGAYLLQETPARTRVRVLHRSPPTAQMLQVQSVCPRGHEDRRAAVVFEDYDAAMTQVKARDNAAGEDCARSREFRS